MAFKAVVLCVSALLIEAISANCITSPERPFLANSGYGLARNSFLEAPGLEVYNSGIPQSSGGSFMVTSTSPIAPTGISVLAENLAIEGPLEVVGSLPLLGTVGFDGALPTSGQAGARYGCGDGNIGMISELGSGTGILADGAGFVKRPGYGLGLGYGRNM